MPTSAKPGPTRRLLGLSVLVMGCWAVSIPAQAGLGDLVDGALEEATEPAVVTTVPITLPPDTVSAVTTQPVILDLPTVSTPEVELTDGEGLLPAVEAPSIVISPPKVEIDPTTAPENERIAADAPREPSDTAVVVRAGALSASTSDRPGLDRSVEIRLVRVDGFSAVDLEETLIAPVAISSAPSSWLGWLQAWLGIESLAAVLSIPLRFLALLLRALVSAGSGLVAPASILIALIVGARGKLVSVR